MSSERSQTLGDDPGGARAPRQHQHQHAAPRQGTGQGQAHAGLVLVRLVRLLRQAGPLAQQL